MLPLESKSARLGELTIVVHRLAKPRLAHVEADEVYYNDAGELVIKHHNAYVRSGLRNSLAREFGLGGTAVGYIGLDNNNTAVTGDTRYLHGAAAGTSVATTLIKAISPAATLITDGAGVVQSVTGGATVTDADFTSGIFIVNKVGFKLSNTLPEPDGDLVDVIGGSGGSAPYNKTFTVDFVNAAPFSYTAQIKVTAVAA
jgi:hypothetical protein